MGITIKFINFDDVESVAALPLQVCTEQSLQTIISLPFSCVPVCVILSFSWLLNPTADIYKWQSPVFDLEVSAADQCLLAIFLLCVILSFQFQRPSFTNGTVLHLTWK